MKMEGKQSRKGEKTADEDGGKKSGAAGLGREKDVNNERNAT